MFVTIVGAAAAGRVGVPHLYTVDQWRPLKMRIAARPRINEPIILAVRQFRATSSSRSYLVATTHLAFVSVDEFGVAVHRRAEGQSPVYEHDMGFTNWRIDPNGRCTSWSRRSGEAG